MATIRKRNNTWEVRYKIKDENGKWRDRSKTFKSAGDAKKFRNEIETKPLDEAIKKVKNTIDLNITFDDFVVDEYIEKYGKQAWTLSNFDNNVSIINYYIRPYFAEYKLKEINIGLLDQYLIDVLDMDMKGRNGTKEKRKVTFSRRDEFKKRLNNIFNYAVYREYLTINPLDKHKFFNSVFNDKKNNENKNKNDEKKDNEKRWNLETSFKAWKQCDSRRLALAMMISITTSLRVGEVTGLTWDNVFIDEENNESYINIVEQLQRIRKETLKNRTSKEKIHRILTNKEGNKTLTALVALKTDKSYRKIRISKFLVNQLKEEKKYQNKMKATLGKQYHDKNLVIAQENGDECCRKLMNNHLKKLIKIGGYGKITYHSFRHIAATLLLELTDNDFKAVQAIFGHSKSGTLLNDVYAGQRTESEIKLTNDLDHKFNELKEKNKSK